MKKSGKGKSPKMEHGDGSGHANMKGGLIQSPMGKAMEGKKGKTR